MGGMLCAQPLEWSRDLGRDDKKHRKKQLNKIQFWGLRLFLQTGPGTPLVSLLWDTTVLKMGLRVKIEKIQLIFHIRSLKKEAIAKKMYMEQI